MSGVDERALLTLDRVGAGRVALLASDSLGFGIGVRGGRTTTGVVTIGPLVDERTRVREESINFVEGEQVVVRQYSLSEALEVAEVRAPDGAISVVNMEPSGPGEFTGTFISPEQGIFEIRSMFSAFLQRGRKPN